MADELETFAQLFSGRHENNLSGEGLKQAVTWLNKDKDTIKKKAFACIAFTEKPADFIITGRSGPKVDSTGALIRQKNDGKEMLNKAIAKYLPMLDEMPDDPKSVAKREDWGDFALINISRIRRVAFWCILKNVLPDDEKLVKNFKARWGSDILEIDMGKPGWSKAAPKSAEIREKQINLFIAEYEQVGNDIK